MVQQTSSKDIEVSGMKYHYISKLIEILNIHGGLLYLYWIEVQRRCYFNKDLSLDIKIVGSVCCSFLNVEWVTEMILWRSATSSVL